MIEMLYSPTTAMVCACKMKCMHYEILFAYTIVCIRFITASKHKKKQYLVAIFILSTSFLFEHFKKNLSHLSFEKKTQC